MQADWRKSLAVRRVLLAAGLFWLVIGLYSPVADLVYWFTVRPPSIPGVTRIHIDSDNVLHVRTPPGAILKKVVEDNSRWLVLAALGLAVAIAGSNVAKPTAAEDTEAEATPDGEEMDDG